mmetsp:Transcript_69669/g.115392  ORF Transcript_69669/g.115392 Transcript_69669/m.115392 type:complete len:410 (+) Transcript_69669:76-1305(+)
MMHSFLHAMDPGDLQMLRYPMLRWYNPPAIEPNHINHKDLGMSPPVYALIFGIISGVSLPIGAWLGITFSPVSDKVVSMMMAFGAGALLFAVTVELYAHALMEVMSGKSGLIEMSATVTGAFIGCASYLVIERWLHESLGVEEEEADAVMAELRKQAMANPGVGGSCSSGGSASSTGVNRQAAGMGAELPPLLLSRQSTGSGELALPRGALRRMDTGELQRVRAVEKAMLVVHSPEVEHARSVALALFLGLLCDGVPEGILMGFLAAESHLTPVLIIALFISNFPTAFSSSSLLVQAEMSMSKIISLWTGLCLLVGGLAGVSSWLLLASFPEFGQAGFQSKSLPISVLIGIALTEGITGGAMLACISGVMLPEAFQRSEKSGAGAFYAHSGFLCVAGFICSLILKTLFG